MSVVRIRESPHYRRFFLKKIFENFVGTLETVRKREVFVPRGSTVCLLHFFAEKFRQLLVTFAKYFVLQNGFNSSKSSQMK